MSPPIRVQSRNIPGGRIKNLLKRLLNVGRSPTTMPKATLVRGI